MTSLRVGMANLQTTKDLENFQKKTTLEEGIYNV